jgi:hypothetical protein
MLGKVLLSFYLLILLLKRLRGGIAFYQTSVSEPAKAELNSLAAVPFEKRKGVKKAEETTSWLGLKKDKKAEEAGKASKTISAKAKTGIEDIKNGKFEILLGSRYD